MRSEGEKNQNNHQSSSQHTCTTARCPKRLLTHGTRNNALGCHFGHGVTPVLSRRYTCPLTVLHLSSHDVTQSRTQTRWRRCSFPSYPTLYLMQITVPGNYSLNPSHTEDQNGHYLQRKGDI